jgi:hypothetical protein
VSGKYFINYLLFKECRKRMGKDAPDPRPIFACFCTQVAVKEPLSTSSITWQKKQ